MRRERDGPEARAGARERVKERAERQKRRSAIKGAPEEAGAPLRERTLGCEPRGKALGEVEGEGDAV